jgi:hypothetical protein
MHFATPADAAAYAARPTEKAIIDYLLTLQVDGRYALMDEIARKFLNSSRNTETARRRAYALLRIAGMAK